MRPTGPVYLNGVPLDRDARCPHALQVVVGRSGVEPASKLMWCPSESMCRDSVYSSMRAVFLMLRVATTLCRPIPTPAPPSFAVLGL